MKILAIGASTSSTSINRQLATYTANLIQGAAVLSLDLRTLVLPIYSEDTEKSEGIPPPAKMFVSHIDQYKGIVLSLAEHNGSFTAAFKNILDWSTRVEKNVWQNTPMFLLSTSPGSRGGSSVMEAAQKSFPHLGADIVASFSLPSFHDTFSEKTGILDPILKGTFRTELAKFEASL